ncbi:MAG: amino acid ABC transporter substrate-binding protein [bacterium]|nr:amino acid ABC transporter substrate-binding protein [bacterium]
MKRKDSIYVKRSLILIVSFLIFMILLSCGKKDPASKTGKESLASESAEAIPEDQFAVKFPKGQSNKDTRFNDLKELLKTALEKTKKNYGEYTIKPSALYMSESRWLISAKKGKTVNVIYRGTDPESEKELIPIYIPTRKGILGYRIFLIRKDYQTKFNEVRTIEDLKNFTVGQGNDWGDAKVLKHNGFNVVGSSTYEGLFAMLILKRFDFFSRGINEAYPEYTARKEKFPDLHIEEKLVLYYTWPYFFYVSPKYPKLAERLAAGLEIMIKDGSYDRIFRKYHGDAIKKSNIHKRKLLKIKNPMLSPKVPIKRKELWFKPL